MKNMPRMFKESEWEQGQLGASEKFVKKVSPAHEKAVDDALNLQLISIRLQKDLIEELKFLAHEEGIGYQPLIRQILTNHLRHPIGRRHRAAGR